METSCRRVAVRAQLLVVSAVAKDAALNGRPVIQRITVSVRLSHTCQVLRFRRSHYGFLDKLKTTAVVRNDYGFTLC